MVTARPDVASSTYMPRSHSSAAVGFPRSRLPSHSSANEHLRSCFHLVVEVPKEILIIILPCFACELLRVVRRQDTIGKVFRGIIVFIELMRLVLHSGFIFSSGRPVCQWELRRS